MFISHMEDMIDRQDTAVTDKNGNNLKRSRHYIIDCITKPNMNGVVEDRSKCHHDSQDGFQAE